MVRPALQQPELRDARVADAELNRGAYRLEYVFSGEAPCAIQRVEVHVRWSRSGAPVAEFRSAYWEFHRLDGDAPAVDRHDFDQERDCWQASDVKLLLRRHALGEPRGEARLEVTKGFLLQPGEVSGAPVDARFGYLSEVDGVPSTAEIILLDGAARFTPDSVFPFGGVATGKGTVLPGAGWRAAERLALRPAVLEGALEHSGYERVD